MWFRVQVHGKPVHVLDTSAGINAIDAAYAFLYLSLFPCICLCLSLFVTDERFKLVGALRQLEEEWNKPERRHPAFKEVDYPLFSVIMLPLLLSYHLPPLFLFLCASSRRFPPLPLRLENDLP
jgi:hypothetical protein